MESTQLTRMESNQMILKVSNLFFNVIVDEVQEKAVVTIASTLARLISADSGDLGQSKAGITFVASNRQSSNQTEVDSFIRRCVSDIQESPESLQAGLSSLLLKTIAVTSVPLQEIVTRLVYLPIVDQVIDPDVKIVNQVAYLTVLINLTQAVADSNLNQPLSALTLLDEAVSTKLIQIINIVFPTGEGNKEEGTVGSQPYQVVRFEKVLYLYCALKDLQGKCKKEASFGSGEFDQRIVQKVGQTLATKVINNDSSDVPKLCFAALSRESNRRPSYVSTILRSIYLATDQNQKVLRAFCAGNLMNDLESVQICFDIFSTLPADDDRQWTLKPAINAAPGDAVDSKIAAFISTNQEQLSFEREMKPLICKHSQCSEERVSQLYATFDRIQDPKTRLLAKVQLVKVNKAARVPDLLAEVEHSKNVDLDLCGKLAMYSILKLPKTHTDDQSKVAQKALLDQLLSASELSLQMYTLKALVARGDPIGFTKLLELIKNRCEAEGEQMDDFSDLFGQIVTKPLSKKWVTKEHGYGSVFRFYEQRLFNQLYPMLTNYKEKDIGFRLIMQCCNLVPMSMVQGKLDELLPLITQAEIDNKQNSVQVQINYLYLFRKVLTTRIEDTEAQSKRENLQQFVPKTLLLLENAAANGPVTHKKVLIEGLTLLNELMKLYPESFLQPYISGVLKMAHKLKSHKKRIVRTVARATVNDWSLLN